MLRTVQPTWYWPVGQLWHTEVGAWYFPAGHPAAVSSEPPPPSSEPPPSSVAAVQEVEPAGEAWPDGQAEQADEAVAALYVSAGQSAQAAALLPPDTALYWPATHAVQLVEPVVEENLPAAQAEQAAAPVSGAELPAEQAPHAVPPVSEAYLPAAHEKQLVPTNSAEGCAPCGGRPEAGAAGRRGTIMRKEAGGNRMAQACREIKKETNKQPFSRHGFMTKRKRRVEERQTW